VGKLWKMMMASLCVCVCLFGGSVYLCFLSSHHSAGAKIYSLDNINRAPNSIRKWVVIKIFEHAESFNHFVRRGWWCGLAMIMGPKQPPTVN